MQMSRPLAATDPAIAELIREETDRQHSQLELIPSENFVSEAVLEAMGSVFTNKYAEGYPGKRYYGGFGVTKKTEQLSIDRAQAPFRPEHPNPQAHSRTPAKRSPSIRAVQARDTLPRRKL